MTDILLRSLAETRQLRRRQVGIALQQLRRRAVETDERGRIDAIRQVQANRSDRCAIADAEAHRMRRVIEVLQIPLMKTERDVAQRAEDVAHVVEDYSLDVFSDEWEPQLDVIEEQSISAEREAGRLRSLSTGNQRSASLVPKRADSGTEGTQ